MIDNGGDDFFVRDAYIAVCHAAAHFGAVGWYPCRLKSRDQGVLSKKFSERENALSSEACAAQREVLIRLNIDDWMIEDVDGFGKEIERDGDRIRIVFLWGMTLRDPVGSGFVSEYACGIGLAHLLNVLSCFGRCAVPVGWAWRENFDEAVSAIFDLVLYGFSDDFLGLF